MTHSVDTSLYWRPPSPFDVLYAKELQAIIARRLRGASLDVFDAFFNGADQVDVAEETGLSLAEVRRIIHSSQQLLAADFAEERIEDQMPGPVSQSHRGTPDDAPYVPSWCYPNSAPKECPCGHHEGYHADNGECLHRATCGCNGIPAECVTPLNEM
jgi:hypothetical protein